MACRCGGTFLTPILAIAGLVAAGAAGYRVISGGCGSCTDQQTSTALVSTGTDHGSECGLCPETTPECAAHTQTACSGELSAHCSGMSAAKVETIVAAPKADGCCMAKGEAAVKTVAATEAKKDGCCSESKTEATAQKVCKEGTDGCTGDGTNGCCGGCEGQKKTEKSDGSVATSGK